MRLIVVLSALALLAGCQTTPEDQQPSAAGVEETVARGANWAAATDFDIAVNMLAQLGKNLIAILGVNIAAPAATAGERRPA